MHQQDEQHKCITSKDAVDNITEADANTLRVQIEITWYNSTAIQDLFSTPLVYIHSRQELQSTDLRFTREGSNRSHQREVEVFE
jgi:hypothetical protein